MKDVTIDVIVPNYNKQPYIRECLNSLIEQNHTNWRCIVIDNFSNDGSWEIIEEFAKNDSRFEVYQTAKAPSFYQTWNLGLSKVKNHYFTVLTSDDVWPQNWLQTGIQLLANNNNAVAVAARTKVINTASHCLGIAAFTQVGEKFFMTEGEQPQIRSGIVSSIAAYFIGPIYTSIHSLILKSEILQKPEQFAEDLGSIADCEWYIRMGLYGDIIYCPNIEVGWRLYEGQATQPIKQQEENGKSIQKFHRRNREEIALRLGSLYEEFKIIAEDYDNHVMAYHCSRPCLRNIYNKPLVEIPKLLQVMSLLGGEFIKDSFYKVQGKNFLLEEGFKTANYVCKLIKNKTEILDNLNITS